MGIATQNLELREKFDGKAEYVVRFMVFIAEEVRDYLAELGLRTLEEATGHAELLDVDRAVEHWKAAGLDLTPLLYVPELLDGAARSQKRVQDHGLERALDQTLIQLAEGALVVGTLLGHKVTKVTDGTGLPDGTITINLTGSAGMSFGAFVPKGITLNLEGDANDYVGKGLFFLGGGASSLSGLRRKRHSWQSTTSSPAT